MEVKVAEDFTDNEQSTPFYVTQDSLLADYSAFVLIRDAPFKPNFDYSLITFQGVSNYIVMKNLYPRVLVMAYEASFQIIVICSYWL